MIGVVGHSRDPTVTGATISEPEWCEDTHDFCDEPLKNDDVDTTTILGLLERKDVATLETLVATQPSLVFNEERHALQLLGCGGSIDAHIPLPPALGPIHPKGGSLTSE
jgi:hypothetical protein